MVIIGIDPGVNKLGFGLIEENGNNLKVLSYGVIRPPYKYNFLEKLNYLYNELKKIFKKFNPEIMVMEEIYLGKNVQVALKIGQVMGMAIGICFENNIKIFLTTPREVKKNIVGKGGATKAQVKFMVENLLNIKNIKNFDESDGLAIALSYISLKKNDLLYIR